MYYYSMQCDNLDYKSKAKKYILRYLQEVKKKKLTKQTKNENDKLQFT